MVVLAFAGGLFADHSGGVVEQLGVDLLRRLRLVDLVVLHDEHVKEGTAGGLSYGAAFELGGAARVV